MDDNTPLQHLRRQRNAAALAAVLMVLAGFAVTFPRSLARYRSLRAAQAELIDLQNKIYHTQYRILDYQRLIREAQQQIILQRGR